MTDWFIPYFWNVDKNILQILISIVSLCLSSDPRWPFTVTVIWAPCWSSHFHKGNTVSARMGSSLDGRTDGDARAHTHTQLTLLSPYVIIFSVWVVVGLCHCVLGRPDHPLSVQQLFLPPWHHTFFCQLLGLLGNATEFLGIWLLVGQHTRGKQKRCLLDYVGQKEELSKLKYEGEE